MAVVEPQVVFVAEGPAKLVLKMVTIILWQHGILGSACVDAHACTSLVALLQGVALARLA